MTPCFRRGFHEPNTKERANARSFVISGKILAAGWEDVGQFFGLHKVALDIFVC